MITSIQIVVHKHLPVTLHRVFHSPDPDQVLDTTISASPLSQDKTYIEMSLTQPLMNLREVSCKVLRAFRRIQIYEDERTKFSNSDRFQTEVFRSEVFYSL